MLMVIAPATLLTLTSLLANIFFALLGVSAGNMLITETAAAAFGGCLLSIYVSSVSYTHLDVYKRQDLNFICETPSENGSAPLLSQPDFLCSDSGILKNPQPDG